MKSLIYALVYVFSLTPGLFIVGLGGGHWCAWVLAAFVSSAYYRFIEPEKRE